MDKASSEDKNICSRVNEEVKVKQDKKRSNNIWNTRKRTYL